MILPDQNSIVIVGLLVCSEFSLSKFPLALTLKFAVISSSSGSAPWSPTLSTGSDVYNNSTIPFSRNA